MRDRSENLAPAYQRAALVIFRAAKDHIKSGGGESPWAPNSTGTSLLIRTGRLINSLAVGGSNSVVEIDGGGVTVGTNVQYARYVQEGTGIYGPGGTPIVPTSSKFLSWIGADGNRIFAKSIQGSPPRKFLYIDQPQADRIRAVFADYIVRGKAPSDA